MYTPSLILHPVDVLALHHSLVFLQVAMLSMQKFSSNVIEKCMDRAQEDVIVTYVQELAHPAAMRPLLQVCLSVLSRNS